MDYLHVCLFLMMYVNFEKDIKHYLIYQAIFGQGVIIFILGVCVATIVNIESGSLLISCLFPGL